MAVLDSLDSIIASARSKGPKIFPVRLLGPTTTTAANTTSGYMTTQRMGSISMPGSWGTGVNGIWPTACWMAAESAVILCGAIEYTLGTLTVSGNSFASGSAMPSKSVMGSSVQTASLLPMIVASVALTATTPVLTVTYTDQDGNTGQTCSMTLPTSPAAGSGFWMVPHLASADTGVRAVTNMSISTGSAGTLKAYGLLPIAFSVCGITGNTVHEHPLASSWPIFLLEASEVVAFYKFGSTSQSQMMAALVGQADY